MEVRDGEMGGGGGNSLEQATLALDDFVLRAFNVPGMGVHSRKISRKSIASESGNTSRYHHPIAALPFHGLRLKNTPRPPKAQAQM